MEINEYFDRNPTVRDEYLQWLLDHSPMGEEQIAEMIESMESDSE